MGGGNGNGKINGKNYFNTLLSMEYSRRKADAVGSYLVRNGVAVSLRPVGTKDLREMGYVHSMYVREADLGTALILYEKNYR